MNYWLLTTEYPPFFGGGISTYCYNTARMMAAEHHSVSVFINDAGVTRIIEEQREGIRIIRFNPSATRAASYLGHTTNINYEFANIVKHYILKEGKPDIIEAQEYLGIAYYLLQFKRLLYDWCRNVPIVITMHSPSFLYMEYNQVPEFRYPNYWICEMERFCLQAADLIISPSDFIYNELRKRFELTNTNVVKIANPFDSRTSNPIDESATSKKGGEIIFFGKLTAQKGAFKLLTYFKNLWDSGFARPLTVIGGQDIVYQAEGMMMGELVRSRYKKYIREGLLILEDRVSPADIGKRLSGAELLIVPSMNDNLPYVVFEMMALGKLLLVSKQGGQAEVIEHNMNGFVFDHEEAGSFAEQLNHALSLDDDSRRRITEAALKKVSDEYGFAAIYKKKIAALEALMNTGRDRDGGRQFPFIRSTKVRRTDRPISGFTEGLLSVVVPYYNMGNFVDETIRSILAAGYLSIEILIVNDGSTEKDSLDQLDTYRRHEQIRVIDGPNRGLGSARNQGAASARGEYLAFLDADDTVRPGYYDASIRVLQQYENVDFCGCWTAYFGHSTAIWPAFNPEPPIILYHNMVNSSALVYKRASFLAGGINDTKMVFQGLEDYDSVLSLMASGYRGVVFPEVFFNYRVRPDSMIRGISRSKKLLLCQYISNKYKNFYATFATDLFNLLNANGPGIAMDNPSLDYHLAEKLPFGGRFSAGIISLIKRNRHAKAFAYKVYRMIKK